MKLPTNPPSLRALMRSRLAIARDRWVPARGLGVLFAWIVLATALRVDAPASEAPTAAPAAPRIPEERWVAMRFGRLVEASGRVVQNAVIVVRNDRIHAVGGPDTPIPANAAYVDLSRLTAIPGLIDVHTHLTYYWDLHDTARPWEQLIARLPAVTVFLAQENARKTLEVGVTTVRDLGSFDHMDIALRDLIQRGAMFGPRMFVAGYGLQITDELPKQSKGTLDSGRADGPAEVMRVVRQQVAAGADWIKMYGSTGSGDDVSGQQTFTYDEMKAAVDAAHNLGKKIAIHSYGASGARDAVRAGADSVEHAVDLDDATLQEMVRRRIYYVPTIDHNRYYMENAAGFGYTATAVERMKSFLARNLQTTRRAHQLGVRIAMGSDAVMTMCGQNTRELAWFVQAGMTPLAALATATTSAASLLGKEKVLGSLAPGYMADIVAVEGDPATDVRSVIYGVRWVMKGGVVMVSRLNEEKNQLRMMD